MTYATINDVMKRYKPIRTIIGSEDLQVTSIDVASIFIADAESLVDSFLANKYVVPLSPVPSYIVQVTADIAIFNILVEHLPHTPDFFKPRYDRAMSILSSVLSGTIVVQSATVATAGDQEAWSTTMQHHAVFSPVLNPEDQFADRDRINEDKSARISDSNVTSSS